MSIVVWLDPGLLTGVIVYDFMTYELKVLDEFDYKNTGLLLDACIPESPFYLNWLYNSGISLPKISIGWESYRIMKGPQSQSPWSLEVIGQTKYLCWKYGYTVLDEAEPNARLVCTDDMIRRIGVWDKIKGKKDAKSSFQHFIAWCLREDCLPEQWKEAVYYGLR